MAYRFNDFAYLTDLSDIPAETIDSLQASTCSCSIVFVSASTRRTCGWIERWSTSN